MPNCPNCGKKVSVWRRDVSSGLCPDCRMSAARKPSSAESQRLQGQLRGGSTGPLVTALAPLASWGGGSTFFCVVAGGIAVFGGFTLLNLKAAAENSLVEAIAHGIGIYCIGKGLFMIASALNFRAGIGQMRQ